MRLLVLIWGLLATGAAAQTRSAEVEQPAPAEETAPTEEAGRPTARDAEIQNLSLFFGDDVVVSVPATREEPLHLAPAQVLVVSRADILARGYRDLSDLLRDVPGVDLSGYVTGEWATAVLFRGLDANGRVIILRDGVPITFPAGTLFVFGRNVPLYDVDRVEILYGPASAVYGADAYAAVIQLITREKVPGAEVNLAGGAFDPLAGFDRPILAGHAHFMHQVEDFAISAGVRTYQTEGPDLLEAYPEALAPIRELDAPYTDRYEAPIRAWNGHLRARLGEIEFGAFYTDHAWSSSAAYEPSSPYEYGFIDDAIWRYRFLQAFALHDTTRGDFDLRTVATWGHYRLHPTTAFHDFGDIFYKFADEQSLRIDHRTVWRAHERFDLTVGARAQAINAVPRSPDLQAPVDPDESLGGLGLDHVIFARYGAFTLLDYRPLDQLLLTGGLSFEHVGNTSENVLLPRAGVVLELFDGDAYLKALYAEAFVPPTPRLEYQRFSIPDTFIFLPNPDLESERLRSAQLVYGHRLHEWVQVEAATYYNAAKDIIQQVFAGTYTAPDGTFFPEAEQNRNLGSLWTAGGEAIVRFGPHPRLQVFASYGYITGEEQIPSGEQLITETRAKIAHHKLLAGATAWVLPTVSLDLRVRWFGAVQTRFSNEQFEGDPMPGYADLDVNLRWVDVLPGLELSLLVQNATDARYFQFSPTEEGAHWQARVPQPPFRVLAGLTWRAGGDAER